MATLLSHPTTINTWSVDVPTNVIRVSAFLNGLDYTDDKHYGIPVPIGEQPEESDEAEDAICALSALAQYHEFLTSEDYIQPDTLEAANEEIIWLNQLNQSWESQQNNEVLRWLAPDNSVLDDIDWALWVWGANVLPDGTIKQFTHEEWYGEVPLDMKELDESWVMGSDV